MSTGPPGAVDRISAAGDRLPAWLRPLAVVAHPDDESFGLGAVLGAFAEHGARVSLLCLTHGEASTLHEAPGELRRVREAEVVAAADILGLSHVELASYPDGALAAFGTSLLDDVDRGARARGADGFVVFHRSGVTGHPDHVAATAAALQVADRLGSRCWSGHCQRPSRSSSTPSSGRPSPATSRATSTSCCPWTGLGSVAPSLPTPVRPLRAARCGDGYGC